MAKKSTTSPAKDIRKILLVEDDTFLAGMYITKLSLEGFNVILASDGEEGIEKFSSEHPDVVLLDIVLPKKSGFEVLKAIRANGQGKAVKVILLTNLGQREDVTQGMKLGADDYLIKAHFMPSEVVEKVKKLV